MKQYRVWAEIQLEALRKNIATIRARLKPQTHILIVVKADAYGHGAVPVAWTALEAGASMLGVGDSSEALQLRESGITGPLLILGAIIEEEIAKVVEYDIATTIHSADFLPLLNAEAERQRKKLKLHLKVDTGMSRLGTSPARAVEIAKEMARYPNLELEGLSTHIAVVASENRTFLQEQLTKFTSVIENLQHERIHPPLVHAANSVATLLTGDAHFNMVRIGIAAYGIDPGIFARQNVSLEPALSLKSRVAFLKNVSADTYIGYDQKHRVSRDTRIATLPVGYNDGYPYLLSGKAYALVHGQKAPLVGTITMDYITVDVGGIDNVHIGDEVTLIGLSATPTGQAGSNHAEQIKVEDLARLIGTIPYEITCALGKRVKRVYV